MVINNVICAQNQNNVICAQNQKKIWILSAGGVSACVPASGQPSHRSNRLVYIYIAIL